MMFSFVYADKSRLCETLPALFKILHDNMSIIAPTGNSYDEDFALWYSNVFPAMHKDPRQIVLMFEGGVLAGYFQYYVNGGVFMMEEIQLKREYFGTGLFGALYSWLVRRLPSDTEYVEAYAHKNNSKSQKILEHLGLSRSEDGKSGNSYHYRGRYSNIVAKYLPKPEVTVQ